MNAECLYSINILSQVPIWSFFHCICCPNEDQVLFLIVCWPCIWLIIRSWEWGWKRIRLENQEEQGTNVKNKKVAFHLTLLTTKLPPDFYFGHEFIFYVSFLIKCWNDADGMLSKIQLQKLQVVCDCFVT